MATPKEMLKGAAETKYEDPEPAINELVERVFTTRNLVHFAHWGTSSYASHMALGDLYDNIVELTDDIVETYMGEFGKLSGLETCECKMTDNIIAEIESDASWLAANRDKISKGSATIQNLLDTLSGAYRKTIYKLKNLH